MQQRHVNQLVTNVRSLVVEKSVEIDDLNKKTDFDRFPKECKNKSALQRHYALGHGIIFRSGSPRPLSVKPRNTFTLYSTPLSRAVRPLCSVRRLARHSSAGIDLADVRTQWESRLNEKSIDEIRLSTTRLRQFYQKGNEHYRTVHLNDIFPFKPEEEDVEKKSLDDFIPKFEDNKLDEINKTLPIRYPKLLDDVSDFYAQFTHPYQSIMKKRPYESSENSNEGKSMD